MCGIVGFLDIRGKYFVRNDRSVSFCAANVQTEELSLPDWLNPDLAMFRSIQRAMSLMTDRGPDDAGIFARPGIILGHRRLAVIDPQGGKQPFVDNNTGIVLIFNGEIFNYRQIREKLISLGRSFITDSDTETLLQAYIEWGTSCLDQLSGMFAFAIYDPRRARMFIARDRLGVKPLFYSLNNERIVFASSCSALRCFPCVSSAMDLHAVSHYLSTVRTSLGRQTMFRDIQMLLPGEYMIVEAHSGTVSIRRYWDIPIVPKDEKQDPGIEYAAGKMRELLTSAVEEQLISDVPLGGFLSGGIDSSTLASLACRMTNGNFNAYSVGYDLEGYHEWPFVREAAAFYNMQCHEIHLDQTDYPSVWHNLIRSKGLPLSTPNEVAIYHLAKAVRRDFTVALSGEGADEILGGYTIPYFSAFDYDRARHSAPAPGEDLSETDMAIRRMYRRPYLICRPDHYFLTNSWIPLAQKRGLVTDSFWAAIAQDEAMFTYYEDWFERLSNCSTFDAYMHIHARVNLEGLLYRVDSSTMAASVEARVPFTDHKMVEFLFGLPDNYKIHWRNGYSDATARSMNVAEIDSKQMLESKRLLRQAFRQDIPRSVMDRPKASFAVPFREWFANGMRGYIQDIMESSDLINTVFDATSTEQLVATAERQSSGLALWPVVNICLWQQECGVTLP